METGVIAVIILKGLSHEITNVKMGEYDHRREQQSCDGGGGGRSAIQICVSCTLFDLSWQKTFPLDEVFASLQETALAVSPKTAVGHSANQHKKRIREGAVRGFK